MTREIKFRIWTSYARRDGFGFSWIEATTVSEQLKLMAFTTEVIGNIYENPELLK